MENLIISIDLNCARITPNMLLSIKKSLAEDYNIVSAKLYNHNSRKHNDYNCLGFEINPSYGSRKRVQLDIPQALDIVEIASKKNIDCVYMICGNIDCKWLIDKLKKMNIKVIAGHDNAVAKVFDNYLPISKFANFEDLEISDNDRDNITAEDAAEEIKLENRTAVNEMGKLEVVQNDIAKTKLESLFKLLNTNKSEILREEYERIIKSR